MLELDQSTNNGSDGDAIKVLVRVRPPETAEAEVDSAGCLTIDAIQNTVTMLSKPDSKVFTFDQVVDTSASQESIFTMVGKRTIENAVDGYNGTIFAYGQTGSGKTFTMLGPSEDSENFHSHLRGVIPRSFEYLFNLIHRKRETHGNEYDFLCRCSFLEIYNEQAFDLLDPSACVLHLRENMKRGVFVEGITEIIVDSAADAYRVLTNGWTNRRVASTSMNRESSRSHAVFTVQIESKRKKEGVQSVKMSQLHLVDLAGSERQKDTQSCGLRLKEAGKINQSLSVLGHVIMTLGDIANGKTRYVPYRDSKLTYLLRNSLGGNAKTHIIACIHPGSRSFGESLSTLQFAKRAKLIKNKAVMNEDTRGSITQLQNEIKRLKETITQLQSSGLTSITDRQDTDVRSPVSCAGPLSADPDKWSGVETQVEWRLKFMSAMHFQQQTQQEQNALAEKVAKLEDANTKKEKYLQSTKMVVKFRENNIVRLEKKLKESFPAEVLREFNEGINADLKEEISGLRQQLEHNPQVTYYAKENQRLRNELKQLQTRQYAALLHQDEQRCKELEATYADLLGQNTARRSVTPMNDGGLAATTAEKCKAQLALLQSQLDDVKQGHEDEKNAWGKAKLDLESDLAAQKAAIEELEKVLEAHHLKSTIERNVMNDIHIQAIKTITTPNKAYNLRNRDVPRFCEPLDFNSSSCDDLMSEVEPEHMRELAHEALTDEIKKLQSQNSKLSESSNEMCLVMHQLKQSNSALERQNKQITEALTAERHKFSALQHDYKSQVEALNISLSDLTDQKEMLTSELDDLRLVVQSIDKERTESREKLTRGTEQFQEELGLVHTKVIQLESELLSVQRRYDSTCEEKQELQDCLDNANATLSFREGQLSETQLILNTERGRLQQNETDVQVLREKVDELSVANKLLRDQMLRQGQDKEQTLVSLMEEVTSQKELVTMLQTELVSAADTRAQLVQHRDQTELDCAALRRELSDNKEAMNNLLIRIQEQKANISVQNEDIEELMAQLEERDSSIKELTSCNDVLRDQLEGVTTQIEISAVEKEEATLQHECEVARLIEDNDKLHDSYIKLEVEFADTQIVMETIQAEVVAKSDRIANLQQELFMAQTDVDEAHATYKLQLAARDLAAVTVTSATDQMDELIRRQADEIAGFKNRQQQMNSLLGELEDSRKTKNEEIINLRHELLFLDSEKTSLQADNRLLRKTLEDITADLRHRTETDDTINRLEGKLREEGCLLNTAEERRAELQATLEMVNYKHIVAEQCLQEKTEDVERLLKLAAKDHEDRIKLESIISEAEENKSRLEKDIKCLQEQNTRLTEENTKLVGHQNLNQKIQYHYNIKQENIKLKEENSKLSIELQRLRPKKTVESLVLKENLKKS